VEYGSFSISRQGKDLKLAGLFEEIVRSAMDLGFAPGAFEIAG